MKAKYDVSVLRVDEVRELPESWTSEDYLKILELTDFDDADALAPEELQDYAVLSLQDLEPEEAAAIVLSYVLGDQLSGGQIKNMAHEMMEEKLWEEYQDIRLHRKLFDCGVLLKLAFPRKFPEAEVLKCRIAVTPLNEVAKEYLASTDETMLARLLAHGMDDHAIINRLFDEQVAGSPFPEARSIVWHFDQTEENGQTIFTIYSSAYWLHEMDDVSFYESSAFPDLATV